MKHWFVLRADALFFCICRRRLYVAYGSIGIGLEVGLKNGLMKKRTFLRNRSRTMCKADYWHLAAFGGIWWKGTKEENIEGYARFISGVCKMKFENGI